MKRAESRDQISFAIAVQVNEEERIGKGIHQRDGRKRARSIVQPDLGVMIYLVGNDVRASIIVDVTKGHRPQLGCGEVRNRLGKSARAVSKRDGKVSVV